MINVYDEFTQLQEVVLGVVNKDLIQYVPQDEQSLIGDIFDQTIEDLDQIQRIYEQHNVKVHRPKVIKQYSNLIQTPSFSTEGIRNPLAPRDSFIVLGNTILETSGHRADMAFDHLYYKNIFLDQYKTCKANWIKMPMPSYDDNCVSTEEIYNVEPIMDAAQICRLGETLLISSVGAVNPIGIDWIIRHFPEYNVVTTGNNINGHIDAQLKILKPGLLITPHSKNDLPDVFASWDIIGANDNSNTAVTNGALFRDEDYTNTFPSCCIVSLNEHAVFLYEHAKISHSKFIKQLEQHDIEVIFVPFRHQHWFNQGLTCLTLELSRQGGKQKYI